MSWVFKEHTVSSISFVPAVGRPLGRHEGQSVSCSMVSRSVGRYNVGRLTHLGMSAGRYVSQSVS